MEPDGVWLVYHVWEDGEELRAVASSVPAAKRCAAREAAIVDPCGGRPVDWEDWREEEGIIPEAEDGRGAAWWELRRWIIDGPLWDEDDDPPL